MKYTLIEIVQSVMNDMDSDEVNSIADTLEAGQVASIARDIYYDIIVRKDWPWLNQLGMLESVSTPSQPVYLKAPPTAKRLIWVQYDTSTSTESTKFEPLEYVDPQTFFWNQNKLDASSDFVEEMTTFNGGTVLYRTDRAPQYYTSVDDVYIITDSIDTTVETALQGPKTQVFMSVSPAWEEADTFVPSLPDEMFPQFVAEVKAAAFQYIKQAPSQKAEEIAQRQRAAMSSRAWVVEGGMTYPNYGRKGNSGKNPQFDKTSTGDGAYPVSTPPNSEIFG